MSTGPGAGRSSSACSASMSKKRAFSASRSLDTVEISFITFFAAREAGTATTLTPPLSFLNNNGRDMPVAMRTPPRRIPSSTTTAPPMLSNERKGCPTIAPIHPPAGFSASTLAVMCPAPRARCNKPKMDNTMSALPTPTRKRCSDSLRRMSAIPNNAIAGGKKNRPKPTSQPKPVSMASPSGPATSR